MNLIIQDMIEKQKNIKKMKQPGQFSHKSRRNVQQPNIYYRNVGLLTSSCY